MSINRAPGLKGISNISALWITTTPWLMKGRACAQHFTLSITCIFWEKNSFLEKVLVPQKSLPLASCCQCHTVTTYLPPTHCPIFNDHAVSTLSPTYVRICISVSVLEPCVSSLCYDLRAPPVSPQGGTWEVVCGEVSWCDSIGRWDQCWELWVLPTFPTG